MSFRQILTDRNYTRDYSEERGHLSKTYMFNDEVVARIGIWDKLFHEPSEVVLGEAVPACIRGCAIGVTWICSTPPPGLVEGMEAEIGRVVEIAKSCGVRIERGEVCGD